MRPIKNIYTIVATDADGIATTQTPLAAGALTLAGALTSGGVLTLATPQHISVTCAADDSARTFTVTGTGFNGGALTETIAGSVATVTKGLKNFKTVTSVTVDAATAGAITIGVLGELETPWIPLNPHIDSFAYSYQVAVGTATFSVESSIENLQEITDPAATATVQASGGVTVAGNSTAPCTGVRVKVTAFTSGTITFRVLQSGLSKC